MQLSVTGHHVEVTDSLRWYVEKKLEQKAEATLHVRGNSIHAACTDPNMYAAIDALTDKLDRCVKKHKEKTNDHHAAEAQKAARAAL